jgi:hypothetical protein
MITLRGSGATASLPLFLLTGWELGLGGGGGGGHGEGKIKALSRDARQVIVCTSFFRETLRTGGSRIVSHAVRHAPCLSKRRSELLSWTA